MLVNYCSPGNTSSPASTPYNVERASPFWKNIRKSCQFICILYLCCTKRWKTYLILGIYMDSEHKLENNFSNTILAHHGQVLQHSKVHEQHQHSLELYTASSIASNLLAFITEAAYPRHYTISNRRQI